MIRERTAARKVSNDSRISEMRTVLKQLCDDRELSGQGLHLAANRADAVAQQAVETAPGGLAIAGQHHLLDGSNTARRHGELVVAERDKGEGFKRAPGHFATDRNRRAAFRA